MTPVFNLLHGYSRIGLTSGFARAYCRYDESALAKRRKFSYAVGHYFSGCFSAAFTKAAKSAACSGCAAASSSGCHCTATRKRPLSVVSTPSTVPSSARALTRSVSAGRFTDW